LECGDLSPLSGRQCLVQRVAVEACRTAWTKSGDKSPHSKTTLASQLHPELPCSAGNRDDFGKRRSIASIPAKSGPPGAAKRCHKDR
jgi:hypothetical protein